MSMSQECKTEVLNDAVYIAEMKGLIKGHVRADNPRLSNPGCSTRDVGDIGDDGAG